MIRAALLGVLAFSTALAGAVAYQSAGEEDVAQNEAPAVASASPGSQPTPAQERSTRRNITELVPETGYVLLPLHVDGPGSGDLSVRMAFRDEGPDPRAAASFVIAPDGFTSSHIAPHPAEYDLAARTAGQEVTCCDLGPRRGPGGPSEIIQGVPHFGEGDTYLMGVAADGWSPDDWAVLEAKGHVEGFRFGEPLTGEHVQVIDLIHEAYSDGDNIRFQGQTLVGEPGQVDRAWMAERANVLLAIWDLEEGRADLSVSLPNGTTLSNAPSQGTWGGLEIFTDPGELALQVTNARAPDEPDNPPSSYALVLLADLPVDTRYVHQGRNAT